jgi:LAS superfamily LD-carboxypeptidase LdcB
MKGINHKYEKQTFFAVLVIAILGFSGAGFFYYGVAKDVIQNTTDLEGKVLELEDKNITLTQTLKTEQQKNNAFSAQIGQIAGTVGKLDQLSKTDKELLQKYSKVYFLNENYVPSELLNVPGDYLYDKNKDTKIHTKVFPFLSSLFNASQMAGIDLKIISAYRSFGEQSSLKGAYLVSYGTGANKFSADQGYSEHQLGTAIDFTTSGLGAGFTDFKNTEAYKWMLNNAYLYGFVLSYPEENTYYQFEPWHWRFVGKSLAGVLHQENKYFYDLDQRTIDSYLINIFD